MGLFDFFRKSKDEPAAAGKARPAKPAAKAAAAPKKSAAKRNPTDVSEGQRVLAHWPGEPFWYPATVVRVNDDTAYVRYDDGDKSALHVKEIGPIDIDEGSQVFARWQQGREYHPARVEKCDGANIFVRYQDGRTENTTISMVRVLRATPWEVDDRVLARWHPEPFFYPAHIAAVTPKSISVRFDDGDRAEVSITDILHLNTKKGDLVFARVRKGPEYHPATITRIQGEEIEVEYARGGSESTTISMVRILPGATLDDIRRSGLPPMPR